MGTLPGGNAEVSEEYLLPPSLRVTVLFTTVLWIPYLRLVQEGKAKVFLLLIGRKLDIV